MKEIIYVQAGQLANYTGTHFWNTQECYFTDDEAEEADQIDSKISFCETIDRQGESTFCPRVLIFDHKAQFGSISTPGQLDIHEEVQPSWTGPIVEHKQEEINKSHYQTLLERGVEHTILPGSLLTPSKGIRFWSDYSRLYYLPRSLQPIPDAETGTAGLSWIDEQAKFDRYDQDTELMESSLRLLVEDCDNLQGLQLMNDTDKFGGFTRGFLASFRDEYLKLPSLIFPTISMGGRQISAPLQDTEARKLLNEALYLRDLNELSTMNILIQEPSFWPQTAWQDPLNWPIGSMYHQSALLSTLYETATVPVRREKSSGEDISNLCQLLKCQRPTAFGELGGCFLSSDDFGDLRVFDLSSQTPTKLSDIYSKLDVTRGFTSDLLENYDEWATISQSSITAPCYRRYRFSAYPLPTSFPSLSDGVVKPSKIISESRASAIRSMPILASLSTSSNITQIIQQYAMFIDQHLKESGRMHLLSSMGLSSDELKELLDDLWRLCDCAEG